MASCLLLGSRSTTYQYPETPIYTQTAGTSYYETSGTTAQVSTPATPQTVASSGSVPMYVSGSPIVASSSSSEAGASNSSVGAGGNGGGGSSGGGSGSGSGSGAGTYVIQGGYMLGNAGQSYSHTTRASPATVSVQPYAEIPQLSGVVLTRPRAWSQRWCSAAVHLSCCVKLWGQLQKCLESGLVGLIGSERWESQSRAEVQPTLGPLSVGTGDWSECLSRCTVPTRQHTLADGLHYFISSTLKNAAASRGGGARL